MTNYYARLNRLDPNGCNIKDGGRRRPAKITGFWGMENFIPTKPNNWLYTWCGVDCPVFKVIEDGDGKITATLEGGEITSTFTNTLHIEIKKWLDDQILELMRWQANVDTPPIDWQPLVVNGMEIGPEILF